MTYDWLAGAVFFVTLSGTTLLGRYLAFRVPVLKQMRDMNAAVDQRKRGRASYREWLRRNGRAARWQALGFYALILPFFISLEALPWWRYIADVVAVIALYDFTYYLTHRFLFHGKPLRRIHALHHQARTPTFGDALYVHPVETLIGQGLFQASIVVIALISGAPLNALTMVVATQLFAQLGALNHAWVDLPRFPYRWLHSLTTGHAAHHVDMNQGNFSQITLLYDWMFGTYEKPVLRASP